MNFLGMGGSQFGGYNQQQGGMMDPGMQGMGQQPGQFNQGFQGPQGHPGMQPGMGGQPQPGGGYMQQQPQQQFQPSSQWVNNMVMWHPAGHVTHSWSHDF